MTFWALVAAILLASVVTSTASRRKGRVDGGDGQDHLDGTVGKKDGRLSRKKIDCPPGWVQVQRKSGPWCHELHDWEYMSWDQAQAACEKDGALLSGFESEDEFNTVLTYVLSKINNKQVFLGARRNPDCEGPGKPGYDKDPNSKCSRKNVVQWASGTATNQDIILNHWSPINPSYTGGFERCLAWLIGVPFTPGANDPYVTGQFNDNRCESALQFLCGRPAGDIIQIKTRSRKH